MRVGMRAITLPVGEYTTINRSTGEVRETLWPVTFEGERVATCRWFTDRYGTRGVTETLYKTSDNRWLVYVWRWSDWQGETCTYQLIQIEPKDLDVGGRFEMLGRAAFPTRPLTLDEALAARPVDPYIEEGEK